MQECNLPSKAAQAYQEQAAQWQVQKWPGPSQSLLKTFPVLQTCSTHSSWLVPTPDTFHTISDIDLYFQAATLSQCRF